MADTTTAPPPVSPDSANATKISFEEQVTAYSALYLMALLCIIWGSIRSLNFVKGLVARKELIETSITTKEAKKFPITASIVLFSLYLVFRTNDGGTAFLLNKAEPYLPEPWMEKAHHIVDTYVKPLVNATNSTVTTPTIREKIGNYHPMLQQGVSYVPELNKTNLVFLLMLLLCWEGCTALAIILKPVFSFILSHLPVGNRWPRRNVPYLFSLKRGKQEMKEGELEKASKERSEYLIYSEFDTHLTIAFLVCSAVGISHLYRRHWITNDLLGVAFSIYGIEMLHLASFKAGTILLAGLFIYDVFWVFATDVMTTVAKGIDAPILLMFPQDLFQNGWLNANKHGMLGLGDIVIPGIFVALLHRFDNYVGTKREKNSKSRYYCAITVIAYALGLFITMGVMHYFKAAQPALLYLVPTCLFIPLLTAAVRGELKALWNYSEEHLVEKHDEEEQKKNTNKQEPAKQQESKKEKKNK
ncbi:signal peptide peptidase domain-containing protein [Ditylenchus destructor]|nr:signal peptide peptidase domain-containing protein [Ditylenchus destructor]